MFPVRIELLGLSMLFIFGICLLIYRISLFWNRQKTKLFNDDIFLLGLIAASFSGTILSIYFLQISALFFILWLIFIVILLFSYKPEKDEESIERFVKKLKEVEKDERITIWDFFTGKITYKLILQRGPEYAAKVTVLFFIIIFIFFYNMFGYFFSAVGLPQIFCNAMTFTLLTPFFAYPQYKKMYATYLNNYEQPYTEDHFERMT